MDVRRCRFVGVGLFVALVACTTGTGQVSGSGGEGEGSGEPTGTLPAGTTPGATIPIGQVAPGASGNAVVGGGNVNPGTGTLPGAVVDGNALPGLPGQNGNVAPGGANLVVDPRYPYAYVGRFDLRNPGQVGFNLPGSKIGVAFTGSSLSVRLATTGADTFNVNIDGVEYASPGNAFNINAADAKVACVPMAQVAMADGNNYPGCILTTPSANMATATTYPIATNLADGNHVAWLSKRNEFLQGNSGSSKFFGFVVNRTGKLLPAPGYRPRRIEFVGDSSTSGFGSAQRNPCGYSSRNSDSTRAIPGLTAEYLRAEVVNLSSSGQGVYRSMYDTNLSHNLPVLYRQVQGLDPRLTLDASNQYDFSTDHVDAVILSAGGDDLWGAAGNGDFSNNDANAQGTATDNFVSTYVQWLAEIRQLRPDATIVVTLTFGAFSRDVVTLGGALQRAVAARVAAGDTKVVYFTYFPVGDPVRNPKNYQTVGDVTAGEKLYLGCTGHPSPGISRFFAAQLGAFVAARLGWKDVGF